MADRYGWCHTAQCVADWSWGQNANNVFTLMGAVATFAAAYLALRFSQGEAKRRQMEDLTRGRLAAIANAHLVTDTHACLMRERGKMEFALTLPGHAGAQQALQAVFALNAIQMEEVSDDALLLLAAIPGGAAFHISRAFARMKHLRESGFRLNAIFHGPSDGEMRAEVESAMATIDQCTNDLLIASAALDEAAKF